MDKLLPPPPCTLTERLNDYLKRNEVSMAEIAGLSGVPLRWVERIAAGLDHNISLHAIQIDSYLFDQGFGDPRRTHFRKGPGDECAKPIAPKSVQRWWPRRTDPYNQKLDRLFNRERTRKGNPKPVAERGRPKAPATGTPTGNRTA